MNRGALNVDIHVHMVSLQVSYPFY